MRIKYPLVKYQGRYENYIYKLYGRKSWLRESGVLNSFFDKFPRKIGMEVFTVANVHEYTDFMSAQGVSPAGLYIRVKALNRFWLWAQEQGLELSNPFKPYIEGLASRKPKAKRLTHRVTLPELVSLFKHSRPALQQYLITLCSEGKGTMIGAPWQFREARKAAGLMHLTLKSVRLSLRQGLWREIISTYLGSLVTTQDQV